MNRLAKVTGDYIRFLRIEHGFSKALVAKKIGVSIYYLNKIEKGELREFKDNITRRVAKGFGMKVSAFIMDIASMYTARYPKELEAEEKLVVKRFGRIYRTLREKKGLTIEQVSRKSKVSPTKILKMERGTIQFRPYDWKAISEAIGSRPKDLMSMVYKEMEREKAIR